MLTTISSRYSQPPPFLHPNMADLYREKVTELARALAHEESRTAANEARVALSTLSCSPLQGRELAIQLQGNLAAMLKARSTGAMPTPLGRWRHELSPDDHELAALATCSLIASDLGSTGCPRLIRPHLSKSHRPHFGIGHAGFGDQTSQLAPLASEASIKNARADGRA